MPKKKSKRSVNAQEKLSKLKPRQRKYIEARAKGKDKKNAALEAGYAKSTARIAGEKIESRATVQEAFQALVRETIDPKRIVARINEGLDATKFETSTINEWVPVPTADGKGTVLKKQSRTEVTELTDFAERRKHSELAAKFGGYYSDKLKLEGLEGLRVEIVNLGA